MVTEEQVVEKLKQCIDPEIPIDIWNLGLIYDIQVNESNITNKQDVAIIMTLTVPGCPMVKHIKEDVQSKLSTIDGINNISIDITFDPKWNSNMISEEARKKLNF
jgi:metal-sulfur cluster biosynthetic enzyme